ncbi:ferredoxin--NADP reductase [bacterium]|nr:ferredoxin--NADP reductase [bacterium]
MPAGFFPLKISKVQRETKDAVSIQFEIPAHLSSQFQYKAGQYLTFSIDLNGEDVRRSYSVCSSPLLDPMPTIAVKEVEGGKMSTYLNREIKEGDTIEVMPPMGKFTVEPQANASNYYVLFGGGSGITPLLSIMRTVLFSEPGSKVMLYYANRDEESIIFKSQIDALVQQYSDRLKVVYSLDTAPEGWNGPEGYLNESKVSDFIRQELGLNYPVAKYYTCGPSPLMDVVVKGLESAGVSKDNIFTEYFTATTKTDEDKKDHAAVVEQESDEIVERNIQVEVFGEQKEVKVKPEQTILIAAQEAGLDPPYSCTVGVCTTCRARLRSGRAMMEEREGLSDVEIEQGYILTCQAHPLSDDVDLVYE